MSPLDRRACLVAAVASALGAVALSGSTGRGRSIEHGALGSSAAPGAARPRRTLKKAVGLGMVDDGASVLDKFTLLRDLGFDGVEMQSPHELAHDEILDAQRKTGVIVNGLVHSLHWSHPFNSPDPAVRAKSVAALETALRDAKRYGATSVLVVPAVVAADKPYDQAWKLSREELGRCAPLAKELGVQIAIENVWNEFLLSPLEAARYVDAFEGDSVRFHFDIGNVVAYGWPEQWVRVLGPRIVKLHVKDYSRKKRDEQGRWAGFDVELGEGDANYPAVMAALDEIGYSTAPEGRWATAEVGGGDRARLARIAEQMDRLLNA